jgi:AcrR family transcriptional regulator
MASLSTTEPSEGRRQRKRQRMLSHLAATAFELFEEWGYDAVTMEQVAAESDVAKATLYNYFPMKEALVAYRFKEEIGGGMSELSNALASKRTFASRMRFLLRESAAWHVSKRAYLPHYLRYINNQTGVDEIKPDGSTAGSVTWAILTEMFRAAQQSGEVSDAFPAEKLGWSLEFLLYGAVTRWLGQSDADLTKEFLLVFDMLMNGVAADKAPRKSGDRPRTVSQKSPRKPK